MLSANILAHRRLPVIKRFKCSIKPLYRSWKALKLNESSNEKRAWKTHVQQLYSGTGICKFVTHTEAVVTSRRLWLHCSPVTGSDLRRRRRISLHRAVVRVACVARRSIACDREKSLTHETFLRLSFQPNTVEVELSCFWPFSLVTFPLNRNLGKLVSRETGLGPGPQDRVVITWFSVFSVLSVTGFFIAISLVRLYWLVSAS